MHYDVGIVGSGFAGSVLARILRRRGLSVVLVERGRHPRFALGESTTPLANLVLERLAERYGLDDLHHLAAYGRWRRHLPELRRGLKRGFTFYRHRRGQPYRNTAANEARLLVAASPSDAIADSHWLRADVDHHLLERAVAEGVDYRDETRLDGCELGDGGTRLIGRHRRRAWQATAGTVVDGSGPTGFLPRALGLERAAPPVRTALIYGHFGGVGDFVELARADGAAIDDGPYADEAAAVHHLLAAGWLYALRFDHAVTSAGAVLRQGEDDLTDDLLAAATGDPAAVWMELLAGYPTLERQLGRAEPLVGPHFVAELPHRLVGPAGPKWFLLPHTFAFYDPMFSTGIAWSLIAIERLAEVLAGESDPRRYAERLPREADQIARLVGLAHAAMGDFERFAAVSLLYFVIVSHAEARQRLRPAADDAWEGFLGGGDAALETLLVDAERRLAAGDEGFPAWVREAIRPFDVAGLGDPGRRNLYPVDLDVLVDRADRLGLDPATVRKALPRLRGE